MSNEKIENLNGLLRGERSATETYAEALKKVDLPEKLDPILEVQSDHIGAVQTLQDAVIRAGGEPDSGSGAWGTLATTVTKAASVFGDDATLKALKQGEEHGVKEYANALESDVFNVQEKAMLRDLYTKQHKHIEKIDQLIS